MRKAILAASFAGILLLTACSSQDASQTPSTDASSSSSSEAMMDSSSSDTSMTLSSMSATDQTDSAMSSSASLQSNTATSSNATVINVAVDNFSFTPSVIRVKKGQKVTLALKGIAGNHGFGVADLGISVPIAAGETKTVDLPTDTAGTFEFRCNIPCGSGHHDMTGQIIVE